MKQTKQNLKRAFRSKLLELCKTRTKKSSPDMFNFYVVLAGHEKVKDAGRATICRLNFKAPSLKTKGTKNEGPFENMSFSKKPFEEFNEKKINV